ncbi:ankyrin repeat-containing domain protein [Xylaria venustula]|nr:ankyrin repeat-containing domain protein [Xylaria venustula]
MEPTKADAIARRRTQNRLAQRRFRWKHDKQNPVAVEPVKQHQHQQHQQQQHQQRLIASKETQNQSQLYPADDGGGDGAGFNGNPGSSTYHARRRLPLSPSPSVSNILPVDAVKGCRFTLFGISALLGAREAAGLAMPVPRITPLYSPPSSATPNTNSTMGSWSATPVSLEQPHLRGTEIGESQSSHTPGLSSLRATEAGPSENALGSHPAFSTLNNPATLEEAKDLHSPLHMAAQKGHERIVRMLLNHVECNEKDPYGKTPLYYAIVGGHEGTVTCLLEHGARTEDLDNHKRSALHMAIVERREGILRQLLDHCRGNEALLNCSDSSGLTPLLAAIDTGFDVGVQLLLQHGASTDHTTRKSM